MVLQQVDQKAIELDLLFSPQSVCHICLMAYSVIWRHHEIHYEGGTLEKCLEVPPHLLPTGNCVVYYPNYLLNFWSRHLGNARVAHAWVV